MKSRWGLLTVLIVAAGLAAVIGSCEEQGNNEELSPIPTAVIAATVDVSQQSPIPTAVVAATVDVSQRMEPELLALVEQEEQQPGRGREQAPKDILFDEEGRVLVIVDLDPDVVVVRPSQSIGEPVGQQEAAQMIAAYGARIRNEIELSNQVGAYVPLDQVKELAREEAVTYIWLSRIIVIDEPPPKPL